MNTQKGFGPIYIILIIIVIVLVAGYFYSSKNKTAPVVINVEDTTPEPVIQKTGNCGFSVTTPLQNAGVSFPLSVTGVVDNTDAENLGCSWIKFEGQAGTAQVCFNDAGEWNMLGGPTPITLMGEWMTNAPVPFSFVIDFPTANIALTPGTAMKIVFSEENPSGMPPVDIFELPVVLQ